MHTPAVALAALFGFFACRWKLTDYADSVLFASRTCFIFALTVWAFPPLLKDSLCIHFCKSAVPRLEWPLHRLESEFPKHVYSRLGERLSKGRPYRWSPKDLRPVGRRRFGALFLRNGVGAFAPGPVFLAIRPQTLEPRGILT